MFQAFQLLSKCERFHAMRYENVFKISEKYDVITFDVFDTLIIRDVMKPVDVFRFSYGEVGRYLRIIAEMRARKASETGEVTLEDIEKKWPFSCQKEIQFERSICRANPVIRKLYDALKTQGKRIYAISDMYLDSKTISGILKKAGYDIPVIVSSEHGCDKRSGRLFKKFLAENSLDPSRVLHIGDSEESDKNGARKAGIACIQVKKHTNHLKYTGYSRNNYELAAFVNHGLYEVDDQISRLGYEIIGPIILAFCQWIHEKNKEEGFERLYFLARDMRFTYDIYRTLYPEDDARYLCVSRKSFEYARKNPGEICKYLRKEGCFGNVAIVDTGWIGNAQVEIEKYAKMIEPKSDIGGLYLGSKLAYRLKKRSSRSHVCLYKNLLEQYKCQLYPPFMETLIGCNEKQVIRYENGNPVFDRDIDRDNTNLLKQGARFFIDNWVARKNKLIPKYMVRKPFERLFYNPQKKDMEMIGDLHYEDFKDTKILSFDEKGHYWKNPVKMLTDLGDSAWKGAFMKRCGVWYPVMLGGYLILGTVRLYLGDRKKNTNNSL